MSNNKETKEDKQAYLGVAITFLGVGVVFLVNDAMRTMGIVFAILGVTFLALATGEDSKKTKKNKKRK